MKRLTVLLANDHMMVREGFRKMIELNDDLEMVGEAVIPELPSSGWLDRLFRIDAKAGA